MFVGGGNFGRGDEFELCVMFVITPKKSHSLIFKDRFEGGYNFGRGRKFEIGVTLNL